MEKESNVIMISVCCYCKVIIGAKNVHVEGLNQFDKDRGFQVSHGICEKCKYKVQEEIANVRIIDKEVINDYAQVQV